MRKTKLFLALVLLALSSNISFGQFYLTGNESFGVKWHQLRTQNYHFIYPAECDSLALSYAFEWERAREAAGYSTGRLPNCAYKKPLPVVLHPYLGYSNGFVAWTPRRMEMYTGPDMYSPEAVPWATLLAIHEQRHVSQMQFAAMKPFRFIRLMTGDLLAGPITTLFIDSAFMEGDAVVTETALTNSGRGRSADFLEYMRACFDEGDMRNFYRWRYGSQALFTPDYYKIGYLTMGGLRAMYNSPMLMDHFFDSRRMRKTIKRESGLPFDQAYETVVRYQADVWNSQADARGPFQPMEQVSPDEKYYTAYSGLTYSDGKIYARRGSIAENNFLVSIDSLGVETAERHIVSGSPLRADKSNGRIYWTEQKVDPRWEMESTSVLCYYDGKRKVILAGGSRYFNPAPNGEVVAVCENPANGASRVTVLSAEDGSVIESYVAPAGVQPLECTWVDGTLYCSAQDAKGQSLRRVGDFEPILESAPVMINHIFSRDGSIYFTSDRTGVNELYALDIETAELRQITSLRQGGKDFTYSDDGYLYFTYLNSKQRALYRTRVEDLCARSVSWNERCYHPFAEILSAQEVLPLQDSLGAEIIGEPKRYSKLLHAFKIHSWAPLFIDWDKISGVSGEEVTSMVDLGATAFFQNNLGNFSGTVGVFAGNGMGAQAHFIYTGLYPVMEAKYSYSTLGTSAMFKTYVPINLSSDGWNRGVIPIASVSMFPTGTEIQGGVRAYTYLPVPSSCIFPRLGIGVEAGAQAVGGIVYPYAKAYGYLPGFTKTQGFRLDADYTPALETTAASVQYAIPFWSVDWNGLEPLTYVRNFEFLPHYEFERTKDLTLSSDYICAHRIGATFDVVLGHIAFLRYDIHLGVKYSYVINGIQDPHSEANLVFSTSLL